MKKTAKVLSHPHSNIVFRTLNIAEASKSNIKSKVTQIILFLLHVEHWIVRDEEELYSNIVAKKSRDEEDKHFLVHQNIELLSWVSSVTRYKDFQVEEEWSKLRNIFKWSQSKVKRDQVIS